MNNEEKIKAIEEVVHNFVDGHHIENITVMFGNPPRVCQMRNEASILACGELAIRITNIIRDGRNSLF